MHTLKSEAMSSAKCRLQSTVKTLSGGGDGKAERAGQKYREIACGGD